VEQADDETSISYPSGVDEKKKYGSLASDVQCPQAGSESRK
jgi:hypothetical protein